MGKYSDIALVALDWSGVVSDDRRPVYEANMNLLGRRGIERITFDDWLGRSCASAADFLGTFGIKGCYDKLNQEYKVELDKVGKEGIVPVMYPDAPQALGALFHTGKTLAVISSHPKENLLNEAHSYGLEEYIAVFYGSTRDKAVKITEVMQELGFSKEETLYIGDTVFDIAAAKRANVTPFGISTGYHSEERLKAEGAVEVPSSLTQLEQLLR